MGRRVLALAVGLLLTVLLPGSALAESVVDQSNDAPGSWEGNSTIPLAQTFTVGMSGTLTGVDLRLKDSPGGSVNVSIETIGRQDRLPTGVVLLSADQPVITAGWYHFSFPTGLHCSAGARLAIVIQFGDTHSGASLVSTDEYPGGQALWKGFAWAALGVGDFAFRTYVDTAAPTSTPTLAPTPTPTPVPTATPTPAPTATPKPAPTATPKPAPTASPKPAASAARASSAPTASVPTDPSNPTESPAATDSNALADLVVTSAPSAPAGSNSGSGSNDSNGSPLPIVIAGIVVAGLLAGGLGFAFVRRRQTPNSPTGS